MPARILIADDDPIQRRLLESLCNRFGYETEAAADGEAALARLKSHNAPKIDLLILDLVMPGLDGLGLLGRLKAAGETLPVIVETTQGATDSGLIAIRAGAADFIVKPAGAERLQISIKNALLAARLAEDVRFLQRRASGHLSLDDLSAESAATARALRLAEKAAKSGIPVLLEGEAGTGREVFARAIHGASARRGGAFVTVNCAALGQEFAESVLFGSDISGSEKNAGKFVEAHGGTLFLEQICELPLQAQEKLLHALCEGMVRPRGPKRPVKIDVRLISSANQNLIERVKLGQFREDLFYRLNVFPIALPALRARREDISGLAARFCARFAVEEGKRLRGLCAEAQALLCAYDWPGNIRQLENAVFRAVVLADGDELTVADFPQIAAKVQGFDVRIPPAPVVPLRLSGPAKEFVRVELRDPNVLPLLDSCGNTRPLDQLEAEAIKFALSHYRGQMSSVARRLGIGRSTLYRKLKQHGLEVHQVDEPACENNAALSARA
ncbi:MAG TPA: sigma-54 dependent transcriptional regulator [Methylocella sp.]|jgi:DNA-binding NtrC family response regulator|nr:sigma-54 dependent transcriptional regulator [Methylocella sp.]